MTYRALSAINDRRSLRGQRVRALIILLSFPVLCVCALGALTYSRWRQERADTGLIRAVNAGNTVAVRHLLEAGANPNARYVPANRGTSFLDLLARLARRRSPEEEYAQPTALIFAADQGHAQAVRLLLDHGAVVDATEGGKGTPLMYAAENGNLETVQLLLDRGANVNAQDISGCAALDRASANGHADVAKLLLNRGATLDARDADGGTALTCAAKFGHARIVRMLLDRGADAGVVENDSRTALRWAREQKYSDIVQMLRQAGATR